MVTGGAVAVVAVVVVIVVLLVSPRTVQFLVNLRGRKGKERKATIKRERERELESKSRKKMMMKKWKAA